MLLSILLFTSTASLASDGQAVAIQAAVAAKGSSGAVASEEVATQRLNAWLDARNDEALAFSPMARTSIGDKTDYDKIDDMSEAAQDRVLAWRKKTVEELATKFDRASLSPEGRRSYDLWTYQYEAAAKAAEFRRSDYVLTQLQGPQATLAQFLVASHSVDDVKDMEAYIARIGGVARAITQLQERAALNAAAGTRPPLFAYDGVIQQSRALITGAPFEGEGDSPIWTDVEKKVGALVEERKINQNRAGQLKAQAKSALLRQWGPAYQRLIDWFEADKVNADKIGTGVGKNPDGAAYYAMRLKYLTTTDFTPDEIHQFGLDEIKRLHAEMEAIKQQVGFKGSLQEFFTYVREDPKFYFPNTDEGRQAYIDQATADIDFIKAKLPQYFGILPKADLVLKRVEPFREQAGAVQHYSAGTPDGSKPGTYYMHLIDMKSMPIPQLEVAAYHEGIPGHHMQISIAQELTDIPKFRSRMVFASYLEGWALYAELLAKEMGAYKDPYSDFGRLTLETWRAIRMVVDTGIHAKGWTEEDAVRYMRENAPLTEGQIATEVRRYIVQPGVASTYKVGMRKILELREKAKQQLGSSFDIRGFHDAVLGGGALPLDMLEQRVDEWVESQGGSTRSSDAQRLEPAWKALDANQDGKVELSELPLQMSYSLKVHDRNNDGIVSLDEYVEFNLDPNAEGRIPLSDNVQLLTNFDYAGTGDPRQALDIYLPKKRAANGPLPVLAYVHGGGWIIGSKVMGRDQIMQLAESGRYAVVSIGYRLAWQDPWPAQLYDAKAGIRWIRAHAQEFGFDPNRICAMGVSAGGQIVDKLGLTNEDPASEGTIGPNLDQSSKVSCVVSEASPTDLRAIPAGVPAIDQFFGGNGEGRADVARNASPVLDVDSSDPPFLIIHGDKDPLVPYQQAVEFDAALRKAGVPVWFQTVRGGSHGGFGAVWPIVNERIRLFLERHLYDKSTEVPTDPIDMKP